MSMEGLSSTAHYLLNKLSMEKTEKGVGGLVKQERHAPAYKHIEPSRASREILGFEAEARPRHMRGTSVSGLGISGMETMSVLSSSPVPGTDSTSEVRSQRPSEDLRSSSRSSFFDFDQSDGLAKSLFAKGGRALRHHGSKLSLASSVSFEKDAESGQVFWSLSGLGARVQRQLQEPASHRRKAISDPFGFKHITHAGEAQVHGLERVSRNELIGEFSAIRAGQRPSTDLRGIKARDLSSEPRSSSLHVTELSVPVMDSSSKLTSPVAPSRSSIQNSTVPKLDHRPTQPDITAAPQPDEQTVSTDQCVRSDASHSAQSCISSQRCPSDPSHLTRLRYSNSMENFSRPVTRTSYLPISPPKRVSSRNALKSLPVPADRPSYTIDAVTDPRKPLRKTARTSRSIVQMPINSPCQDRATNIPVVGHAISTTDDSARHLKSSPLPRIPPSLEDVVEEGDTFNNDQSADSSSRHRSQTLPLRHVQSLPATRVQERLIPVESKRHTSPAIGPHQHHIPHDSRSAWSISHSRPPVYKDARISVGFKSISIEHWEDVVDECYEHAAEADSDFDWNHIMADSTATEASCADSVSSLPELDSSATSSFESADWEGMAHVAVPSHGLFCTVSSEVSPAKNPKVRGSPRLSYSLFPTTITPPRTP